MQVWRKSHLYMDCIQRSFPDFSIYFLAHRSISQWVSSAQGQITSNEFSSKFLGVFAVGSLMVGSVRLRIVPDFGKNVTGIENSSLIGDITNTAQVTEEITPAMVISALTFGVGIIQASF